MRRLIEDSFAPAQISDARIHSIVGMSDPFSYRDKIASPFAPARKGMCGKEFGGSDCAQHITYGWHTQRAEHYRASVQRAGRRGTSTQCAGHRGTSGARVAYGLYAAGTHAIVPVQKCVIEAPVGRIVIHAIASLMQKFHVAPYDEDRGTGLIRHAIVRVGHATGEVLVTIVTAQDEWTHSKQFAKQLVKRVPSITTVVQNVNERATNAMLGAKEHVLYGPGFILDKVCGVSFRISSKTFFQVDARQTEVLYQTAIRMAHLDRIAPDGRTLRILDAYCGSGAIGLIAAHQCAHAEVIGVEAVASAVQDAQQNARHNGITNAHFVHGDATDWILHTSEAVRHAIDVIFMDPPRSGSTPAFLRACVTASPQVIVYVSCDPKTQMRDMKTLVAGGYKISEICPVDMFPHTTHIESIVVLTRRLAD